MKKYKRCTMITCVICLGLIFSGCSGKPVTAANEVAASPQTEQIVPGNNMDNISSYEKTGEIIIENVNLDNQNGNNDKIKLTSYKNTDDIWDSYTLLEVCLGTDTVLQQEYNGAYDLLEVTHGKLFSEDKDGFVVRLGYFGSNYGAADVYAYDIVRESEGFSMLEKLSLRDLNEDIDFRKSPNSIFYKYQSENVFWGEVFHISEIDKDGIKLRFYGREQLPFSIIYWQDDEWKVYEEGVE